jgi:2-polyprenyl-3-methyl-5-hydroxy-6-metoxy-1,4-benzoquinol methylase
MTAPFDDDAFGETVGPHLFRQAEWTAAAAQVAALVRLVGLVPSMRALDVPCGPGRQAIGLARRGIRVTGVDRTQVFLDEARRQASRAGVALELVTPELDALLRSCGFAQVDVYGSLGGRPCDHRALALVAVART